jgi:hypothetical protein
MLELDDCSSQLNMQRRDIWLRDAERSMLLLLQPNSVHSIWSKSKEMGKSFVTFNRNMLNRNNRKTKHNQGTASHLLLHWMICCVGGMMVLFQNYEILLWMGCFWWQIGTISRT